MLRDRPPVSRDVPRADEQAHDHLRYIRDVMGRSEPFTAVPGRGLVAMGLTALAATALSLVQPSLAGWLRVWTAEALVGGAIGFWALRHKAHTVGLSLRSGTGRKYLQSLLPPLAAGAVITLALYVRSLALGGPDFYAAEAARGWDGSHGGGTLDLLPGVWLLLYGTGTVTGGLSSIALVPRVGLAFMALGIAALFLPLFYATLLLALGFGGLHVLAGLLIWRRYGG